MMTNDEIESKLDELRNSIVVATIRDYGAPKDTEKTEDLGELFTATFRYIQRLKADSRGR